MRLVALFFLQEQFFPNQYLINLKFFDLLSLQLQERGWTEKYEVELERTTSHLRKSLTAYHLEYLFDDIAIELFRITNGGTYYNIVCRSISTNLPGIDLIVKQKHRNIMKNISSKLKKESDPLKRAQLEILAKVIETRRRGSINYRLGNKGGSRKTCYIRQKKNCKTKRVRRR